MPVSLFDALHGRQKPQSDFGLTRQQIDAAAAQFRQQNRDPAREWSQARQQLDPRTANLIESISRSLAARLYK